MFKPPTENDITSNKKMTPAQTVRALYTAQWKFYKHGYETMLKIAGFQLLLIIILAVSVMFLAMLGNPPPKYFARNAQNQVIPLLPLADPQHTDEDVRQFVADALLASMNFTYDDYKLRLENAATYFTDGAFANLDNAYQASSLYKQLEEKQLLMRTNLISVPQIDKNASKSAGGRYYWVVYADVQRTLSDRVETRNTPYRYRILVQQVQTTERSRGLAIYSLREENSPTR
jgi:hypothetical protein